MSGMALARLNAMVEEATLDCHDEDEQLDGLFTMIEDDLDVPFDTVVLGVSVTVEGVELSRGRQLVAICARGRWRQAVPLIDLPLPTPPPAGAEWIDAYRHWLDPSATR